MTDHELWNNVDEISGGTSQETLSPTENQLDDGNTLQPSSSFQQHTANNNERDVSLSPANSFTVQMVTNLPESQDQINLIGSTFAPSLVVNVDEETQMFCENSPATGESPRDITSPGGGDNSSPFETMESDGLELNDQDDSMFPISVNNGMRRSFPENHWPTNFSTTTPGGSSDDDDPYASTGSKKKRRRCGRTKRDNMYSLSYEKHTLNYSPWGSQIPSPVPSGEACAIETEDSNAQVSCFQFPTKQTLNGNKNPSDSNIHAFLTGNRRASNASEGSHGVSARDGKVLSDLHGCANTLVADNENNLSAPQDSAKNNKKSPIQTRRRPHHRTAHQRKTQANSTQTLHTQYPSSASGCSLSIITQPEPQHRARYTSEGSRGPVKDLSQQSYPQLELKGYVGKTTLHVFVGSESDDKTKPHGFYQACKVTGRNTTTCKEVVIDGTQVIHIPFDTKEIISVDCVGILKLRNADVEARIGVTKAKKKSQTVRLVFRVALDDVPGHSSENPLTLQVVSDHINCTQPQGQPEITKKSLDRCPASGGMEMFIIGRNFYKGLKVIFQDPEEADGSHWHEIGQVDKDTFNGNHMVVHVPAYHDQNIQKPVNVQVVVEHNLKRCEPHSFTYDPIPKTKTVEPEVPVVTESIKEEPGISSDSLQALLNGVDPKVFALFAKLLTDPNNSKVLPAGLLTPSTTNQQLSAFPPQQANQPVQQQPILFTGLPSSTVEKPTPNFGFMPQVESNFPSASGVIKPAMFGGKNINNQTQPSQFGGLVQSGSNVVQNAPQVTAHKFGQSGANAMNRPSATNINVMVKTEAQTPFWPDQQTKFPNINSEGTFVSNSNIGFGNNNAEVRTSMQLPLQVVSSMPSQVNLNENSVSFQQPPQASTPVQNKSPPVQTDFNLIPTTTWSQHVDMAAPNLSILTSGTSVASTSMFNFSIPATATVNASMQQPWSSSVQITGVNFSSQFQSQMQQPVTNAGQQFTSGIMASEVVSPTGVSQTQLQQQNIQLQQQQAQQQQNVLFQQQKNTQQQNIQVVPSNVQLQQQQNKLQQNIQQPQQNQQINQLQQNLQLQQNNVQQNIFQQANVQQQNLQLQQQQSVQQNIQLQQNIQGQQQNVQLQQQNSVQQTGQQQQLQQQQNIQIQQQNGQQTQNVQPLWSPDQQTNTSSPSLFSQNIQQQQLFTISESMQIFDGNKPPNLTLSTNNQQQNFQQILLSPSSENVRSDLAQSSPLVTSETGLTLGFENTFNIAENVLLTSPTKHEEGILESIISDCSNPPNISFNASGDHLQQNNSKVSDVGQPVMQLQQNLVNNSSPEQFFGQNITPTDTNNTSGNVQQFQESNDIEMISILNQDKGFMGQSSVNAGSKGISLEEIPAQNVVDINTYLVNPNSVQPMLHNQQMLVDSTPVNNISSQVSFVNNNPLLSTSNFQQNQPNQQAIGQMTTTEEITQITGIKSDHSVLSLGNGSNADGFVNKPEFSEFSPPTSVANNEPNNNFFNN